MSNTTELLVLAARQQLTEAVEAAERALEVLILATPTSVKRDKLCDANILIGTVKTLIEE